MIDTRPIGIFTGEPIPPGKTRWVDLTADMLTDYEDGYFLPLDMRTTNGTTQVLIGDHRVVGYGDPHCEDCHLAAQDWDLAETPCAPRSRHVGHISELHPC